MAQDVHERPRVDRLLSVREVAEQYGVGPTTVRRLVHDGRLRAVRLMPGGRLRFRERDVQALIDNGLEEE